MPGKRLGDQMYVMPVFVEECNMGMCLSWIVYTVLDVYNHWSGIYGGSGVENGMERWV